jgi:hypothetical protein
MEFSGRTTNHAPIHDDRWKTADKGEPAVRKQWVFDVQWSDCPVEIEEEVIRLWRDEELGNDRYISKYEIGLFTEETYGRSYPLIDEYLMSQGLTENDEVWIHWWW